MTDRPIPFRAPMIRALLEGRKTQTRRVLKPQPEADFISATMDADSYTVRPALLFGGPTCNMLRRLPRAGDRLWVREAWRTHEAYDDLAPSQMGGEEPVRYEADGAHQTWGFPAISKIGRYRHARFMPRWASRLTLIVEGVKVERLQDISEADAIAEGPGFVGKHSGEVCESVAAHRLGGPRWRNARDWYADLWDSIHRPGAWDANPWVCAVTLRVIRANIDAAHP